MDIIRFPYPGRNGHETAQMTRRLILVAVGAVAATAAVTLAVHGLGVSSGTVCPRSTDANWSPYNGTAMQARACGLTVYPLVTTTQLPDGGTQYVYQGPGNKAITENTPPAGFNPVSATAAERALYGLPPEPPLTNPIAHAHWLKEIRSIKSWVSPPPFLYVASS